MHLGTTSGRTGSSRGAPSGSPETRAGKALVRGLLRRGRHPQFDILPFDILPFDILPFDILPFDILPFDILPFDTWRLDTWRLDTWRLRCRAWGRSLFRVERWCPSSTSPSNELAEEPKCTARGVDEDQ